MDDFLILCFITLFLSFYLLNNLFSLCLPNEIDALLMVNHLPWTDISYVLFAFAKLVLFAISYEE